MRIAQLAAGKKRYGLGERFAPTRGQVDPQGYIKRELKKQPISKGPSQTRSGLAQSALKNIRGYMGSGSDGRGPQGGQIRPSGPKMHTKPVSNFPTDFTPIVKTKPAPHGQPQQIITNPEPAVQPSVKINANGQLDLPFNEAFSMDLIGQRQQANAELLDLQQQQQMQQMEYQSALRNSETQFKELMKHTLNENAARGTAFSSQYGVGASRNTRDYNNFVNDLNANNTMALTGFANQRGNIENALNDYIRQSTLGGVMDLAPEAGDLGYGIAAPEPMPMPGRGPVQGSVKHGPNNPLGVFGHKPVRSTEKPSKIPGFRAEQGKGGSSKPTHKPAPKPSSKKKGK